MSATRLAPVPFLTATGLAAVLLAASPAARAQRELAKLLASDGEPGDRFGAAVALDGDAVVIGAWGEWSIDDTCSQDPPFGGVCNVGAGYLFERQATGLWVEQAKFTSSDAAEGDLVGWSVSLAAHGALLGAWRDDDAGTDSGSAILFDLSSPRRSGSIRRIR